MYHLLEVLYSSATENNMIFSKPKTMYQFFSLWDNNAEFSLIIDQMLQKSASTKYLGGCTSWR